MNARVSGIRGLLGSIGRREAVLAAVITVLAVAVTSVPPVFGYVSGLARDMQWTGAQVLASGDTPVYLSYIDQTKSGAILHRDLFTTEPLVPVLNVLWLAVGLLARVADLTPLAAYHAARVALIPALAAVAYLFIAYFVARPRTRIAAFAILMFGSGFGLPLAAVLPWTEMSGGRYEWPIDLWVGESNVFLTMMYSPHFVASWALLLLTLLLFALAADSGRLRTAVGAGVAALALFQFHPFHVPTVYGVCCGLLLARALRYGLAKIPWKPYAILIAVSSPSVAYHAWLAASRNLELMVGANLTYTPSVWHVLAGFGAIAAFALYGYLRPASPDALGRDKMDLLAIWISVQAILIYAPLSFQRRLLEGLQFPLAVLAGIGVVAAAERLSARPAFGRAFAASGGALLAAALFLPSTFGAVGRNLELYMTNRPPIFYVNRDTMEAMRWLRERTPERAVTLSLRTTGALIPPYAARTAYVGHLVATLDARRKSSEAERFFSARDDDWRRPFVERNGITHVYVGPEERVLGGTMDTGLFRSVFRAGDVEIYEITR